MLKSTLLLASTALVAAQSSSSEPCASVASQLQESTSIEAQAAFDCLDSVPVDVQGNSQLIDELKELWQFQSELVWLKKPGDDWEFGPLDIEAELDNVKNNLGSFSSEYAVQLAIQNITIRTGNFHFNYRPDILQVFSFFRQANVASISEDGKALPKLYLADDVASVAEGSSDVSEITEINGQNPYDFLTSVSWSQYIDSDGLLNDMLSKGDTDNTGSFMDQKRYDGPSTDITWANGSTASIPNYAATDRSFVGVTDGQSFFDTFCVGSNESPLSASTKGASDSSPVALPKPKLPSVSNHIVAPSAPGPVPRIPLGTNRNKRQTMGSSPGSYAENIVAADSNGVVVGAFLSGEGYDDIAVLKIISFSNPGSDLTESEFGTDFQQTVASFLTQCVGENKQKLIIDLRENGGGSTNLLLDTFIQLFPEMEPFSGQRYRASDAFVKIGDAVNEIRSDSAKASEYASLLNESIEEGSMYRYWSWWHFRNADGADFKGWDDFDGPVELNGDSFTRTMRYNYTDQVSILPPDWYFTNGTRPTPFKASNIIMYTDALCGSSCASFHEELKNIAGVKAVTVGGRPENKPIQTVTGSKGGEVTPLFFWQQYAQVALNISTALSLSAYSDNDASLSALANVPQVLTRAGDQSSRLQSQDQVRKGDASGTPLQYIYEASDCKIFYTATTYANPDAAWKQAWDAFQDDTKCVEGSTGHASSISGGFKAYGPGELKAEDQPKGNGGGGGGSGDGDDESAASITGASGLVITVAAIFSAVIL
ncbi:hypothetical protein J4E93_002515 [Alternaria ventricosa]|uniref:uncharacterized protein n=1 Tax=Alternaria ventricosa TaxID=1187951 RepID=UPI0020C349AF|nr:uncharacterized protein J4E93_002515 [Alternaria ventricosa]KAI4652315.1 hypothetical protein J4E93_002515 [Alternaria ventricosa]